MEEQPIRILHVIGIMNRGGAETMIMNLYRRMDRTRVQFDFVENSPEPAAFDGEIQALGGRIYRCPHYNGKNHFQYKRWWNAFFQAHAGEYGIIHGHLGSTAAIYLKIAKKYGLYTIAHSHSSGTDHSLKNLLYKMISYPTRNIADYFFACSEAAGRDRFGKAVSASDRCKVLNNTIDTEQFRLDAAVRAAMRKEFGLTDEMLVGHVGRFTGEKNHMFILDVFKAIRENNSACKLILVGDGPLRQSVQERAKELNIEQDTIFTGVRSDVNRLLQAMDVLLFPSLYEGLPVTIVEAQASGLPCVLSDRVPEECKLTDAVRFIPLEEPPEIWAGHVTEAAGRERKDASQAIRAAHYDISESAPWLENFYVSITRQKDGV